MVVRKMTDFKVCLAHAHGPADNIVEEGTLRSYEVKLVPHIEI